jgi:stage V sporulation protein S
MAGVVRQSGAVEVQVIGAGALNQAIKAIAIARGYVAPSGIDLVCVPTFHDIEIEGEGRTAIRLAIEDRDHRQPHPQSQAPAASSSAASDDITAALVGSTVDLTTFDPPRPQPSTF